MCREVFRPVVFACVVIASSACQPQRPGVQEGLANGLAGLVGSTEAIRSAGDTVTYFGDLFSKEEEVLAARPVEVVVAPTF